MAVYRLDVLSKKNLVSKRDGMKNIIAYIYQNLNKILHKILSCKVI